MTDASVILDVSPDGIALVMLNRPSKRNAMTSEMVAALQDTFDTLHGADHVRVVFIKGAGGVLSSGFDIDTLAAQAVHDRSYNEEDANDMAKMLSTLRTLPQLTVVLAEGFAMGAAMGLVCAADWVVAKQGVTFRIAAPRIGQNAATLVPFLIEAIGARHARALMASTSPIDADGARILGLAHEVVSDDAGLDAAMARLSGYALENSPNAVRQIKDAIHHANGRKFDHSLLADMARRDADNRVSAAAREGVNAFVEKRRPVWPIDES